MFNWSLCVCVCARVCECVRACVHACIRTRVSACLCTRELPSFSGVSSAKSRVWQRWESSWIRGITFCITRLYCENSRSTCSQRIALREDRLFSQCLKKKKKSPVFYTGFYSFLGWIWQPGTVVQVQLNLAC
jgi:hypothetical protein